MARLARPIAFALVIVVAIVATAVVGRVLTPNHDVGATSTISEAPSATANGSDVANASPPVSEGSRANDVTFVGDLFALPDVGCPGLWVDGAAYFLQIPEGLEWKPDGLFGADGSVVARRGDTIRVEGVEAGPEICWATGIDQSIQVSSVTRIEQAAADHTTFVGRLTRFCDLGACCPALDVSGTLYALQLGYAHVWRHAGMRYEIRDREGTILAKEDELIAATGRENAGDTCWATILEHSIRVRTIGPAE